VGEAIRDLIEKRKELERKYRWVTSKTLDSNLDFVDKRRRKKVEQDDIDIDIEDLAGDRDRDKDKGGDKKGATRQVYENLEYVSSISMLHLCAWPVEYVSLGRKLPAQDPTFRRFSEG